MTAAPDLQVYPSPNYGPRRGGALPDMVVLHYTAMAETDAVLRWLSDPANEVSAHYVLSPAGEVWQLVEEVERAWHAGASRWGAVTDVNSRSIGIEIVNTGATPFAARQMDALERLLRRILMRWSIPPHRVVGHSCVAPGRKIDPGRHFDWARLARKDLAISAQANPVAEADQTRFAASLAQIGYTADCDFDTLHQAFRLRHAPWMKGALTAWETGIAKDLAARFPVDAAAPLA